MPTLDAFLTDVRACTRCAPHLPHGVQPVFQFHPSAPILIAGQAPGARVHASGVPFDDASGGAMKVIACIEDPIVIKQILDHLKHKAETSGTRALPESRAPPAELLLGLFD